jgi:hypothetical protein
MSQALRWTDFVAGVVDLFGDERLDTLVDVDPCPCLILMLL